jgi:hypothetical protein
MRCFSKFVFGFPKPELGALGSDEEGLGEATADFSVWRTLATGWRFSKT